MCRPRGRLRVAARAVMILACPLYVQDGREAQGSLPARRVSLTNPSKLRITPFLDSFEVRTILPEPRDLRVGGMSWPNNVSDENNVDESYI
jgi:hypothetical protein